MTDRLRHRLLTGLLLLAACASDPTGPAVEPLPAFRLLETQAWAGATIHLRADAPWIADGAELRLDDIALPLTTIDDTTFAAELPATASGALSFTLTQEKRTVAIGSLTVRGVTEGFAISTTAREWTPFVAAGRQYFATRVNDGVSLIDLSARSVRHIPIPSAYSIEISPGAAPGLFTAAADRGTNTSEIAAQVWRLAPEPAFVESRVVQGAGIFYVSIVGPATTIAGFNNILVSFNKAILSWIETSTPRRLIMSPTFDRILPSDSYGAGLTTKEGLMVFGVPSGERLYTLPGAQVMAACFSNDGTRIAYLSSRKRDRVLDDLHIVHASDGTPVLSAPLLLPPGISIRWSATEIAFSQDNALLFVVGYQSATDTEQILVYDTATLTLQGRIALPGLAFNNPNVGDHLNLVTAPDGDLYFMRHYLSVMNVFRIALP